jgi:hypothetical protein
MRLKQALKVIVSVSAVLLGIAVGVQVIQYQLNQSDAVEKAIILARQYGLQKTRPDSFAVQQMTLNEWNYLVGIESGPDAAKFGLDPNQRVWVIAMKGDVVMAGPGSTGEKFDNITIVLNVETAEQKGTFIAGPGQPLPLAVP